MIFVVGGEAWEVSMSDNIQDLNKQTLVKYNHQKVYYLHHQWVWGCPKLDY